MKTLKRAYDNMNYYDMRGGSMLPTLRAGEGVTIDSEIDVTLLNPGDIIVFKDPKGSDKNIIHRIIRKCDDGYITQGDNNKTPDDHIVRHDNILGKALTRRRGNKSFPLSSGFEGLVHHRLLKTKKSFLLYFGNTVSIISHSIEESRIFNIFNCFIRIDIITIKKGNSCSELVLHNNKLLGKKCMQSGKWKIKFPYKFFVNKNKLP